VMPSNPADAKGLTKAAIRDHNPVAIVAHPNFFTVRGPVPDGEHLTGIGTAAVVRQGKDITLVACGLFVERALQAANVLAEEGVSVEVVDLRTLSPLDSATLIASAKSTGRVVVCDQGHRSCGIAVTAAAEIQEKAFASLKVPVAIVTSGDAPIPFNTMLEDQLTPTVQSLVDAARSCLGTRL
jgi:acetoin:2,6-dichlorophenolindophenol oxidoreductase subunit beta